MKDLIERLEELDAPCRECDAEIHAILNPEDKITFIRCDKTDELLSIEVEYPCGGKDLDEILSYTASIDAALTLIPDGFTADMWTRRGGAGASVWKEKHPIIFSSDTYFGKSAVNLATAICIAALRSRQSIIDGER